ncbi:unnamed protein product, partial [Rotaria socialis]
MATDLFTPNPPE